MPMISRKMLCGSFERSFLECEKMAALNQEMFAPGTDDTIEELRNGAKNIVTEPAKVLRFG